MHHYPKLKYKDAIDSSLLPLYNTLPISLHLTINLSGSLHLVQDSTGELVCAAVSSHITCSDLSVQLVSMVVASENQTACGCAMGECDEVENEAYPSAITS